MSDCSRTSAAGGFTLIEVAVALALGATVMMALFAMYEGVLDASAQMRAASVTDRAVRVALGVVEDDLRSLSVVPGSGLRVLGEALDEDTGAEGEVLLVMTTSATLDLSAKLPHLGVQFVEYVLEDTSGGGRFMRRERPHAGVQGDFPWTEVALLGHVESIEVAFWSTGFNEYTTNWSMGGGAELPLAVRVSFVLDPEAGSRRYDLVVPLPGNLEEGS